MQGKKVSAWTWLYRKILYWFLDTPFWFNLLKYTLPFIRFTLYYAKMNRLTYLRLYNQLQPGDLVFQLDSDKLTSKIIGGKWAHVGICVDKGEGQVEIVDMTHGGFREIDFFEFCAESARVAIGRVIDDRWTEEVKQEFIQNAWKEDGSKYNFTFRAKEKHDPRIHGPTTKDGGKVHKFNYCSQLVMVVDKRDIIDASWEDLAGLGVPYVSPTGIANASNVKIIGDSGEYHGHH